MRWGIIADIHGNLEALQAVLASLTKEDINSYLCLGDIVGYGADPQRCISEIKRLNPQTIAGNHDWASAGIFDLTYFNPEAKSAILWTSQNITAPEKEFLKSLELIYQTKDLTLVHASLKNPEQFEYIFDLASADRSFQLLSTKICFIGHTHTPVVFIKERGKIAYTFQTRLIINTSQTYIVNAGSVGQPRDGNPQGSYVVFDSDSKELTIKRVTYDIQRAQNKIIKAGLPRTLAERLAIGR